jgi:hypothetical protein
VSDWARGSRVTAVNAAEGHAAVKRDFRAVVVDVLVERDQSGLVLLDELNAAGHPAGFGIHVAWDHTRLCQPPPMRMLVVARPGSHRAARFARRCTASVTAVLLHSSA